MKKIATVFLSALTAIMVLLTCVACSQATNNNMLNNKFLTYFI